MRLWLLKRFFASCLAFGALSFAGCGGSSSETPEPARPESWQFKARHRRQLAAASEAEPRRELSRAESLDVAHAPRSTWGTSGNQPTLATRPPPTLALPDPYAAEEDSNRTSASPAGKASRSAAPNGKASRGSVAKHEATHGATPAGKASRSVAPAGKASSQGTAPNGKATQPLAPAKKVVQPKRDEAVPEKP
jgi:hypothetical protein